MGADPDDMLKVFICHSSEDKTVVRELYSRLKNDGFAPWIDEEDILPGQDWDTEIKKAVRRSDVILVCLSHTSVAKSGYIQKEIKFALDVADEKPEGTIFIIPLKLEKCKVPERLCRWQYATLFEEQGYQKLTRALKVRAEECRLSWNPPVHRKEKIVSDLVTLKNQAESGDTPKLRRAALRKIALHYGAKEQKWLMDFVWKCKYWAARREAIDQVIKLDNENTTAWLKKIAEEHNNQDNRYHAIEQLAKIEGHKVFMWVIGRFTEEKGFSNRIYLSRIIRRLSRDTDSIYKNFTKDELIILKRISESEGHADVRMCIVGATLNLFSAENWSRPWLMKMINNEKSSYYKASLLGIALKVWPKDLAIIAQLKNILKTGDNVSSINANYILKKLNL